MEIRRSCTLRASAGCLNRSVGFGLEDFAGESKHFGFGDDGYAVRCAAVRRVALMVWEFAEAAGPNPTRPYHGYYFRVLKEQGPNAPGGQHSYVLGKAMIGGFALVAWPATYGVTGVHTFMVNQDGVVYEKDRGAHAAPGTSFDPDRTWTPVE